MGRQWWVMAERVVLLRAVAAAAVWAWIFVTVGFNGPISINLFHSDLFSKEST